MEVQECLKERKDNFNRGDLVDSSINRLSRDSSRENWLKNTSTRVPGSGLKLLDMNLSRLGISLQNSKKGKLFSTSSSGLILKNLEQSQFFSKQDPKERQQRAGSIEEIKYDELMSRQNQFYGNRPKQGGILKRQSSIQRNSSFEESGEDKTVRLPDSQRSQKSINQFSGGLSRAKDISFDQQGNVQNKGGRKYKLLHEIEQDPKSDMYLPRRIENFLKTLQQSKCKSGVSGLTGQSSSIEREQYERENNTISKIHAFNEDSKQQMKEYDNRFPRLLEEEDNPLGLISEEQFREILGDRKKDQWEMDVVCHVTNISTQSSEKENVGIIKISHKEVLRSVLKNAFEKVCKRTGLVWHNEFDQLVSLSVIHVDSKKRPISLTEKLDKPLEKLEFDAKGQLIIEFFVSEAPILRNTGYECYPSLQELIELPLEELQRVESFQIRNIHGIISFESPVDLTRQDLDQIILIEQSKAYIYPDHLFAGKCPKLGNKLNQQALITLFCIDDRAYAKHQQHILNYDQIENKLKILTKKNNCEFVAFDKNSFHFTFRVFDWTC